MNQKQNLKIPAAAANKQGGATVIEYALIAALIAVAVYTAVSTLGGTVGDKFDEANTSITGGGG